MTAWPPPTHVAVLVVVARLVAAVIAYGCFCFGAWLAVQ